MKMERCKYCIDRADGVYGSFAPPCPEHDVGAADTTSDCALNLCHPNATHEAGRSATNVQAPGGPNWCNGCSPENCVGCPIPSNGATNAVQESREVLGWIYEDELPENYPYDAMFPHSKVDTVRIFPVFGPQAASPTPPAEQQALTTQQADEVVAILRAYQSNLGSCEEACSTGGMKMWRRIDVACGLLEASPSAEQHAQPGAVYAELPEPYSTVAPAARPVWKAEQMRDFADRTHALRMQAVAAAANAAGMLLIKTAGDTYAMVENNTATASVHPSRDPQAAPVELGPDGKEWAKTEAGYKHVESMMSKADGETRAPYWHGWALRGAFVAGAEWQEGRARK